MGCSNVSSRVGSSSQRFRGHGIHRFDDRVVAGCAVNDLEFVCPAFCWSRESTVISDWLRATAGMRLAGVGAGIEPNCCGETH
jgi:hypothetical protein